MITLDDLVHINEFIAQDCGQQSIMINKTNLLSALSVQQWYDDKAQRAAALVRSITIAHGFQDGNKRTAAIAGFMVAEYTCSEDELICCIKDIACGTLKDVEETPFV